MMGPISKCPVWSSSELSYEAYGRFAEQTWYVDDSPRAGGGFILPNDVFIAKVHSMSEVQKTRLTTWLIDQRIQGTEQPEITAAVIDYVKTKPPLPVHERAERLLRFIAGQTDPVGTEYEIRRGDPAAYAWSESTDKVEIGHSIQYLMKEGWVDSNPKARLVQFGIYATPAYVWVTVDGYRRVSALRTTVDSSQAFVARWFDDLMQQAQEHGIEPAIKDAGYKPLRIDQKEHINKIDDEIMAEIRRSRFLVADFTHGVDGARGGVYYEAGFAHGLNLPVIFTCREDAVEELHFDTEHYNHIVWTTPADLREKLTNRILAVIGEGPEARVNP